MSKPTQRRASAFLFCAVAGMLLLARVSAAQAVVDRAADSLYLDALRGRDPAVKFWAAVSAPQHVQNASAALKETYLRIWTSKDLNLRGHVYEGITKWRVRSAAPLFAPLLRSADWAERSIAAQAIGGSGDMNYLSQLRAMSEADPRGNVRSSAYEGLTHLIGAESLPDLWRAASDMDDGVRANAGVSGFRLARRTPDAAVQAEVRRLLSTLAGDYAPSVSSYAKDLLRQLETP